MARKQKQIRPKARLPKGLRDISASEIRSLNRMLDVIRRQFEIYGFEPLETPAFEYTDALGKFLPDQDRPNEGVFSFEDEDNQWLSLRYDLTAPLARYVAEHYDVLPKPFRRYQTGPVWRNEKPGPGRFRQFTQFDADTVGTTNIAADAELCMLAADCLEALGIPRGNYVIRVNNRKILDGILESIGVDPHDTDHVGKRLTILRAIDKLDRLEIKGVELLLGKGRKDESGDFTKGAGLEPDQISTIIQYSQTSYFADTPKLRIQAAAEGELPSEPMAGGKIFSAWSKTFSVWKKLVSSSEIGIQGIAELEKMAVLFTASNFGPGRISFDASVVRGLDYYTGPVFEAELTHEIEDEDGGPVRFGSVGGGGR